MTSPSGGSSAWAIAEAASATAVDLEALLAQSARQHQAQLGVVLDDEQSEDRHVAASMALAHLTRT